MMDEISPFVNTHRRRLRKNNKFLKLETVFAYLRCLESESRKMNRFFNDHSEEEESEEEEVSEEDAGVLDASLRKLIVRTYVGLLLAWEFP